jgi:hypothetical protein
MQESPLHDVLGSAGQGLRCGQRLIELRGAERVATPGADEFFHDLAEKILSLSSFDKPHPLSATTAVATMKRYLVEDRYRIQLDDLVRGEVERVIAATSDEKMPVAGSRDVAAEARSRLSQYEAVGSIVRDLFITAARWANPTQAYLFTESIERLADWPERGGVTVLLNMRRYPAVLVLYAGGVAAVAGGNLRMLRILLLDPRLRNGRVDGMRRPAVQELYPQAILDSQQGSEVLTPNQQTYTPLNNRLFEVLREPLRDAIPSDEKYEEAFDLFEYLLALVHVDSQQVDGISASWFPIGRFGWRSRWRSTPLVVERLAKDIEAMGEQWSGISVGLFGSLARCQAALAIVGKTFEGRR